VSAVWTGTPVKAAGPDPAAWFEPVEPTTEALSTVEPAVEPARQAEAQHQAELTQIDLPPVLHLLSDARLVPQPWQPPTWQQVQQWCRRLPWVDLAVWALGVAQLALGVALGYLLMLILLGLAR
jgi:hypothetical protein